MTDQERRTAETEMQSRKQFPLLCDVAHPLSPADSWITTVHQNQVLFLHIFRGTLMNLK